MGEDAEVNLKKDLENALRNKEFVLQYQPIINIESNEIVGIEALIRWNHPTKGQISPNTFIPYAEESNIIAGIEDWVLREACIQCKKWQDKTKKTIKMAVNISPNQLETDNFIEKVSKVLLETGIKPSNLVFEITERMAISNLYETIQKLKELKNLGISISLDDFGVGYSSFIYLQDLPIDTIKIGQQLIKSIVKRETDFLIVATIISLAKDLNLDVIVEGVETNKQLKLIKQTTCKKVQGYLYSKPKYASDLEL